jgi:hypothetical protein
VHTPPSPAPPARSPARHHTSPTRLLRICAAACTGFRYTGGRHKRPSTDHTLHMKT